MYVTAMVVVVDEALPCSSPACGVPPGHCTVRVAVQDGLTAQALAEEVEEEETATILEVLTAAEVTMHAGSSHCSD